MRRRAGLWWLPVAAVLWGCSSDGERGPAAPPLSVDRGRGSQYGNYAAEADGETRGPAGERCVMFNWDRPLTKDLAIRYRSASCESGQRPGVMISREISRTIIPLADSNLRGDAGQP